MWIKNEKGCWINLALAFNVDYGKHYDEYVVYAEFPFYFGKNVADSSFDEKRRLKTFKTAEDAEKFIEDLFDHMNTGAKVGYAFTWLANKPAEKSVEKPADETFNFGGITVKDPVEFKKFLEVLRERLNQADAYNLVGE